MVNAFRPSRNLLIGSAKREGAMDLADIGIGGLSDIQDEMTRQQGQRQLTQATVAMQAEWGRLEAFMIEKANKPEEWNNYYTMSKEQIRKGVLSGVTQPGARQLVTGKMEEKMAEWEWEINNRALLQTVKNANVDFKMMADDWLTNSRMYGSSFDLESNLKDWNQQVDRGAGNGYDLTATPAMADQLRKEGNIKIISDYLLQDALAAGDDSALTLAHAGEIAKQYGIKNPFGRDDIGNLQETYRRKVNANKAEDEKERKDNADSFERAIRLSLNDLKLRHEGKDIRDLIRANQDLTPEKMGTLLNLYDQAIEEINNPKSVDETKKWEAYTEIMGIQNLEERRKAIDEKRDQLGFTLAKEKYDETYDTVKANDPVTKEILDMYGDLRRASLSIVEAHQKGEKYKTKKEYLEAIRETHFEINTNLAQIIEQDKNLREQGKSPQARRNAYNDGMKKIKEKQVQEIVKSLKTYPGAGGWYFPYGLIYSDIWPAKRKEEEPRDITKLSTEELRQIAEGK